MNEDFDFFEAAGLSEQPDTSDAAPSRRRRNGRGNDNNRHGRSDAGRTMGLIAGAFGMISLIAGIATLVHAIAPSVSVVVPADALIPIGVVTALAAVVAIVVARRQARAALVRRRPGTVVVLMVCGTVLCVVLGLLIAHMVPGGVVKPAVRDAAPVGNVQQMKQGIDTATGTCAGGWKDVDASAYPGVSDVSLCEDNRMAFVTFDTAAAASMDRGAATNVIEQQLRSHADDPRTHGDWKILNGGRWMAVGENKSILSLQRLWGGTVESVR